MRRAVIFSVITTLLLAVAGVTVAQEGGVFDPGAPAGVTTATTVPESTSPDREATQPAASEATTTGATTLVEETTSTDEDPSAADEGKGEITEKPGNASGKGQRGNGAAGSNGTQASEERNPDEGAGRPEGVGKPENAGKGGNGRGGGSGEAEDDGGGQEKVTICHKGKKTLSVGAPAQSAHVRHGDSAGACG